jgi:hypothetical protein
MKRKKSMARGRRKVWQGGGGGGGAKEEEEGEGDLQKKGGELASKHQRFPVNYLLKSQVNKKCRGRTLKARELCKEIEDKGEVLQDEGVQKNAKGMERVR